MNDSASRLSAHESTGWKPVAHDRQDAYPPAHWSVLGILPAAASLAHTEITPGIFIAHGSYEICQRPKIVRQFAALGLPA